MKKSIEAKSILIQVVNDLSSAKKQLKHSLSQCNEMKNKLDYNQEELDKLEALSSRFARLVDILLKRSYRTLDVYLLEEGGTFLDVLNKAEKRGLFNSLDEIRIIKDIRNLIAHEYAQSHFGKIISDIFSFSPNLLCLVDKFENYCKKIIL